MNTVLVSSLTTAIIILLLLISFGLGVVVGVNRSSNVIDEDDE